MGIEININPVAVDLGYFKIHWYGIMYLLAFTLAYYIGAYRAKTMVGWNKSQVYDLMFFVALGSVIGGRLGYVLFYDFAAQMRDPWFVLKVWRGGMSFHGGLLGALFAAWLFGRKTYRTFFTVTDFLAPMVPLGLAAGRFGNFINGELWGKPTDLPWAMKFVRTDPDNEFRHPSMLYEMLLEGFVLFAIIWFFSAKPRPQAAISGLWLFCYGLFRFTVEFVRVPDENLGYLAWGWVTMGQVLSLPMIIIGLWLLYYAYTTKKPAKTIKVH